MTEGNIFDFLVKTRCDFPKLHLEASAEIAEGLSNIIFDTLKVKSHAASEKRLTVLKFLQALAADCDDHLAITEANYHIFLKSVQLDKSDNFETFLKLNQQELQKSDLSDLFAQIQCFYARKEAENQRKLAKLEMIKKFNLAAPYKIYCKSSDQFVANLLKSVVPTREKQVSQIENYREKQIQCAYALLNLQNFQALDGILEKLAKYDCLEQFEVNFLTYVNQNFPQFRPFLFGNFMFIYEKILLVLCTQILRVKSGDLPTFFQELSTNKDASIVLELRRIHRHFQLKLNEIIFELYNKSFCHRNLLEFLNYCNNNSNNKIKSAI